MSHPLLHRIHVENGVVVTVWTGAASDAEMKESHQALYGHPAWRPGMHELVDLRRADLSQVTLDGMRALAGLVVRSMGESLATFRTALLVTSDLEFGMGRLYAGHQPEELGATRVFRAEPEALSWLGLTRWPDPETGISVNVPRRDPEN